MNTGTPLTRQLSALQDFVILSIAKIGGHNPKVIQEIINEIDKEIVDLPENEYKEKILELRNRLSEIVNSSV